MSKLLATTIALGLATAYVAPVLAADKAPTTKSELREPNRGWLELDLFFLPNLLGLCRVRQWHRYGLRLGNIVARATTQ